MKDSQWRFKRYDESMRLLPKGGTYLDVGCNDGEMARRMLKAGYAVIGMDHRKYFGEKPNGFEFVQGDAHKMPFDDDSFDYCICFEVLEHVPFPAKVVTEMCRVARKAVFVTVPVNRNVLDPGHVNFYKTSCCLKILMPGCKVHKLRGCENRWYFSEWNVCDR